MSSLKEMLKLFALFLCCSVSLSDWMEEYNNDTRPLCSNVRTKKPRRDERRFVDAIVAGRRRFPFAVGLLVKNLIFQWDEVFCQGTLITDRHVLTAAHCVYPMTNESKESINVTVADYEIEVPNEVTSYLRKIDTVHPHPDYREEYSIDSDIAIFTLDQPIPLNRRMKIPVLPTLGSKLITGTRCTIWGWEVDDTAFSRSTFLMKVRIDIVAREKCQEQTSHLIPQNMICAGGEQGKDMCFNDNGASLLFQVEGVDCVVGISSFNFDYTCGIKGIPSVYVNVAKFTDWIYTNTKTASCKPEIMDPVSNK